MVRNTSFSVFAGQVTGMFGLIGSGRTETAKIIAGVLKRDMLHGGEVKLDGRPVRYRVPQPAVRDGIVYVTEDRKLEGFFETMSIGGNLNVSAHGNQGRDFQRWSTWPRCVASPRNGSTQSKFAPLTAMRG